MEKLQDFEGASPNKELGIIDSVDGHEEQRM